MLEIIKYFHENPDAYWGLFGIIALVGWIVVWAIKAWQGWDE